MAMPTTSAEDVEEMSVSGLGVATMVSSWFLSSPVPLLHRFGSLALRRLSTRVAHILSVGSRPG